MKLFDFIKVMFSNSDEYENLNYHTRSKNRFMVQQFMSIKFPTSASLLNRNGSNPAYVNDCYRMIGKKFNRPPKWIYTKVKKTKSNTKDFVPEESTIKFYLNKNGASMRDYNEILKSPRKQLMLDELKELEKLLKENGYEA